MKCTRVKGIIAETLPSHGNARWTPDKLLAPGVLMSWHEGQTLASGFEHVRELLAAMFPDWTVPASYTGYATALAREITPLIAHLKPQLQCRYVELPAHAGRPTAGLCLPPMGRGLNRRGPKRTRPDWAVPASSGPRRRCLYCPR